MKINKDTAREKFRSSVNIKDIHSVSKQDPNYEYKKVSATFKEGLGRIDRYIDAGWEVVYSDEASKDDRATAATQGSKEDGLRQKPVTFTSRSGTDQYILMRCHKDQRKQNESVKHAIRKERFEAMQKRKPKKVGRETTIIGDDVDLGNN